MKGPTNTWMPGALFGGMYAAWLSRSRILLLPAGCRYDTRSANGDRVTDLCRRFGVSGTFEY